MFYALFTSIYFSVVLLQLDIGVGFQVEQGLRESLSTMQTSVDSGAMTLDDLRTPAEYARTYLFEHQ